MSRGGRGGFRGGRGGLGSSLGLDYDQSLDLLTDTKPSETFPPIPPPIAEPPSHLERAAVHHYRTLRARIHDGAFYCILDPSARISKAAPQHRVGRAGTPQTAFFNAFDSQPTYTQKFRKTRNALPNLTKRPFVRDFFPPELWPTMGVDDDTAVAAAGGDGKPAKKKLEISQRTRLDKWMKNTADDDNGDPQDDDDEKDDDVDDADEKPGEEADENEDPDQFAEDDEDDNDDYNAEQYFSGGEDDDYGDDGGGGGDDDY